MSEKAIELSHVILYVNKNVPKSDVSSFCTKIRSEDPDIGFTYLCYDNQTPGFLSDGLLNLLTLENDNRDSLFIITDSADAMDAVSDRGMGCAALLTSDNRDCDFSRVLYCIEDIGYMPLYRIRRMWQRYHGIPWTISRTDRLVIREQVMDDLDGLYEIYDDPDAVRYVEALFEDRRKEEDYLRRYIDNQYRFYEYGQWALTLKDSGELIGRAGISVREGYDLPELGYIIGKRYRRCGYAAEALEAIMGYAEKELDIHEFMAFTDGTNIPSVRLLRKLGFSLTGQDMIMGRPHDTYILTKP